MSLGLAGCQVSGFCTSVVVCDAVVVSAIIVIMIMFCHGGC